MEKRIKEAEFDEFEKLLGEIPNATSKVPINETLGMKPSKNQNFCGENLSAKNFKKCTSHQEEIELPDDQSLTSAFADLSFKETSPPLVYEQYPNIVHELPYSFDYPSLQNKFTRGNPEIGLQFVPNMPNFPGTINFPFILNQQERFHLPPQQLKPQMIFGATEKDLYYLMHQHPIPANGNATPHHLMSHNFRNSCEDIRFGIYNQEASWNKERLINHGFQEKMLPKYLGLNSLKNEILRDRNKNGKFFSKNQCNDFKCNSLRPLTQSCSYDSIDEVVGRIYFMAKDQNGCRFLQRKFTEGTQKDVEIIFSEIIMHVIELMTDTFGNYLIQKLLEVCNEDQRMQILHTITRKSEDLIRISCDMHGTRAVQKIVETLRTPEQFLLVISSLKPAIVPLMKNINGNHVAQRCLQYLAPEYSEFLYEAAFASCVELATDRHGCCVIQKCLSHCDGEKWHRIMCEITSNSLILAQDQYGNYVVQFVLKTRVSWAILDILDQLEGNYGDLSMQKYSSNVIERCLKHAKEEHQSRIIKELITDRCFDQILQDPYGNYVVQAALKRSKATLHGALVEAIKPHIPLLRTSPYGKKVLQAIT